jgi:N-acetylmuramoyl-L-alanine amidase
MFRKFFLVIPVFAFILLSSFTDSTTYPKQSPTLKTIIVDAGHGLPDGGARGNYSNESDITLAIAKKVGEKLKEVLPDCKIIYTRTDRNLPNGMSDKNAANRYRAKMANENHGDLYISIHVNSMAVKYRKEVVGHKKQTYRTYVGKGKSRKRVTKTRTVPVYKYYKLPCSNSGTETYIWAINKNDQKKEFVGSNEEMAAENDSTDVEMDFDSPEAKILASLRTKKYFNNSLLLATFVEDEFKKQGRSSAGVKQRNYMGIWVLQATAMPSILVETGFICNPDDEDYLNSDKGQNEVSYAVMRAVLRYKESLESGNIPAVTTDSTATPANP